MSEPGVYAFLDYREFLRAWLDKNPKVSQNGLARAVGVSHSMMSSILAGKRDLDATRVGALAAAVGLDGEETLYLSWLVDLEDSSLARRQTASTHITAARRFRFAGPVREDSVRLFAHWSYGAIWQLARLPGFDEDPAWIAARLEVPLREIEIVDALAALSALGLLVRDENGRVCGIPEDRVMADLPGGILSGALRQWHRWHLDHLASCVASVGPAERAVYGLTVAVSADQLDKIRARMQALIREVAAITAETDGADRVYQVELGFAPLARPTGSRRRDAAPPTSSIPPRDRTE